MIWNFFLTTFSFDSIVRNKHNQFFLHKWGKEIIWASLKFLIFLYYCFLCQFFCDHVDCFGFKTDRFKFLLCTKLFLSIILVQAVIFNLTWPLLEIFFWSKCFFFLCIILSLLYSVLSFILWLNPVWICPGRQPSLELPVGTLKKKHIFILCKIQDF